MPGDQVAVASAVLMISRRRASTEMAGAIIAHHHMGWYSISGGLGIRPESTVTVTNGGPANVRGRGRGHLGKNRSEDEAEAGTLGGGTGPQAVIVTVTGTAFVTGGAKLQCRRLTALTDRFRFTTAHALSVGWYGNALLYYCICTTESQAPVFGDLIHLIRAIRRDRNVLKHLGRGVRVINTLEPPLPGHYDIFFPLPRPHL